MTRAWAAFWSGFAVPFGGKSASEVIVEVNSSRGLEEQIKDFMQDVTYDTLRQVAKEIDSYESTSEKQEANQAEPTAKEGQADQLNLPL